MTMTIEERNEKRRLALEAARSAKNEKRAAAAAETGTGIPDTAPPPPRDTPVMPDPVKATAPSNAVAAELLALPVTAGAAGTAGDFPAVMAPGFHGCLVRNDPAEMARYQGAIPGGVFAKASHNVVRNPELFTTGPGGLLTFGDAVIYVTREERYQEALAAMRSDAVERVKSMGKQEFSDPEGHLHRSGAVEHSRGRSASAPPSFEDGDDD